MRLRSRSLFPKIARQATCVVALLAYLASAIGVPLPASWSKQTGVPYPCQSHSCGCLSASECWDHCCCFTPRQKLAWAREHAVTPPQQLVVEVTAADQVLLASHEDHADHDHADHDHSCYDHSDQKHAECGPADHASCGHGSCDHQHGDHEHDKSECATQRPLPNEPACTATNDAVSPSCCESHDANIGLAKSLVRPSCCETGGKPAQNCCGKSSDESPVPKFVWGFQARKCRGAVDTWLACGAVLPPPSHGGWHFEWLVIAWINPLGTLAASCDQSPPIPPPRV